MVTAWQGVRGPKDSDMNLVTLLAVLRLPKVKEKLEPLEKRFARVLNNTGGDWDAAKDEIRSDKECLLAFQCGTADERGDKNLKTYAGVVIGDIDRLTSTKVAELLSQIKADPHVVDAGISPSGHGVKALFAVSGGANQHRQNWEAVRQYVLKNYGHEIDAQTKNIERLCFIFRCPLGEPNWQAMPLDPAAETPEAMRDTPFEQGKRKAAERVTNAKNNGDGRDQRSGREREHKPVSKELLRQLLDHIPADNRQDWMSVLAACKLWGGATGQPDLAYEIVDDWSRTSKKYDAHDQQRVWDSLDRENGDNVVTLGTVFKLAKDNGWKCGEHEQIITTLATFGPIEYDVVRDKYAKELGCRPGTLDKLVDQARHKLAKAKNGDGFGHEQVEPWAEPVDGGQLMNDLLATVARFIVVSDAGLVAISLWTPHAYAFDLFQFSPILSVRSPDRQCGKSRLLALLAKLLPRPLKADSVSDAVLYRSIGAWMPSLLLDEWDSQRPEMKEAIRNVLNSGFEQGGCTWRCVGDDFTPTSFPTYCPKVVAGIGELPPTAASRSITLMLHRKLTNEKVERLRDFDGTELKRKMLRWVADNKEMLAAAKPTLPSELDDRQADIWEPLFAIADLCGQGQLARLAALRLADREDGETLGAELLADVRRAFNDYGDERVRTEDLLSRLNNMTDRPWPTLINGKEINAHRLSKLLRQFELQSTTLRVRGKVAKGYSLDQFTDAFARYLPAPEQGPEHNPNDTSCEAR
jgi:hypothetical protein